ncbi:hypothetical protein [Alkalihalobacillus sp. TS-13]|uniref:hypothetical protein n=1 Tax=Alkalihalobacillus sp. TS-13 TaxID=2842455 RepID=UPI001C8828FD|nr:hypothetical protein [Alkalihalobacillus sp. TS-13]
MKKDQFDNLKETMDKELYGSIRFSNSAKEEVLDRMKETKGQRKPMFKLMFVSVATIAVLFVFGSIFLSQGFGTKESATQQNSDEAETEQLVQNDKLGKEDDVESDKDTAVSAEGGLSKEWKDLTNPEDVPETHPTNAKDMIAGANEGVEAGVPEQYLDDPMYYKTMGAGILRFSLRGITVEGEAIERDFENLTNLCILIHTEELKRYEHLDLPEGEWPQAHVDQWKDPSKTMEKAMMYYKGLLNDLDIAINHNGEGETSGYAHMVDGEKVDELEAFIPPEEELADVEYRDE